MEQTAPVCAEAKQPLSGQRAVDSTIAAALGHRRPLMGDARACDRAPSRGSARTSAGGEEPLPCGTNSEFAIGGTLQYSRIILVYHRIAITLVSDTS